jgi:hypothetical protein
MGSSAATAGIRCLASASRYAGGIPERFVQFIWATESIMIQPLVISLLGATPGRFFVLISSYLLDRVAWLRVKKS